MRLPIAGPLTPLHIADGASFNTFTTFQDVSPVPQLVLPQQQMDAGLELFLWADGEFSTTGTPTLSIGFWFNGAAGAAPTSILAQSSVITTGSGAAAWPWTAWWRGRLRAIGSSASFKGQGHLILGTSLIAESMTPIPVTQALRTVTVDTTANRAVGVGAAWGTSNASNNIICYNLSALAIS
jgi:hypothetical protein